MGRRKLSSMSRLVIYGAGGFGREVWALACTTREVVFCDDTRTGDLLGAPIIHRDAVLPTDELFVAMADTVARARVAKSFSGVGFASLVAPTAVIAPDVTIGDGAFFCHFSHAAVSAAIGRHLICHVYAYIGHENVIGDYVTVGPRASLNGCVTVGDGAYIGSAAVVRQGVTIGAGATIGMGAVVTKDVAPGAVVVGNPAASIIRDRPALVA